ncbi:MAG: response regulator [Clostridia bacterium]|nr:response regulator [Clostridia bacterium]NCC44828.1 response regulator [Clostridia bacterium]
MEKKVLLVADDDEMNRKVIHRFLKDTYEVVEAQDGEEALQLLNERSIDAVLLDIIMPKVDGLEVLKSVRQNIRFDNVGILVATSTKEKTERAALSLGADDIVAKPYDPIVIKKRLENILLMKEVKIEKEMLQSDDVSSYKRAEMKKYSAQIGLSADKLHRIAGIIRRNKDNTSLIAEMLDEIDIEADKIIKVFSENDR